MYHLSNSYIPRQRSLTLLLLNTTCPVLANSVDPDQLASEEANGSGSALFVIKYMNFYQKSNNLIGWKWDWHLNLFSMTSVKNNKTKTHVKNVTESWSLY